MKPKNKKKLRQQLSDFFHSSAALRLLVCAVGLAVLVTIYVVAIVPVRYNLRVGMVPYATITATKDVEDTYATEQARRQAANAAHRSRPRFTAPRWVIGSRENCRAKLRLYFAKRYTSYPLSSSMGTI